MDNLENEIVLGRGKNENSLRGPQSLSHNEYRRRRESFGFLSVSIGLGRIRHFFRVCRGCVTYLSIEMVWTCERQCVLMVLACWTFDVTVGLDRG